MASLRDLVDLLDRVWGRWPGERSDIADPLILEDGHVCCGGFVIMV